MANSELICKNSHRFIRRIFRIRVATLVMLSVVICVIGITTAWFTGEGTISYLFANLELLQENPPIWLTVPIVADQKYLLLPTITLLVFIFAVIKISPHPRFWSGFLIVGVLLGLMGRYIVWRSLSTLNLTDPLNGVFSLGLFLLEMLMLASSTIQLFLMLNVRHRSRQASQLELSVINGTFTPTVDILIPTYNEPDFILRRTIIGCQAINYLNKKVYILDDTKRPEIQQLALTLGCDYITRPDDSYSKAGNLNHAIAQTTGELIVVFDADFIPTRNFLTRTIGFFQNKELGLIQTPQSFYNTDPVALNLGLEDILTPDEEVFYRQIQPIRDGVGGVVCAGTSFIIRRRGIAEIDGFVTNTLSEDYFTGIRLSAVGYQVIYLDEKLSAGLAAESIATHIAQRLRWARGTLQAFFIEENPLTIPGLNPLQRLAHLEGLLNWFTSFSRLGFLMIPLAYLFIDNVIPLKATVAEFLYFFLPYYAVQISVVSWLNYRSRSAIFSEIYFLILGFPLAFTIIQVMLNPFSQPFKVTPKGVKRDRFMFNWSLALPLVMLWIAIAIGLLRNFILSIMNYASIDASTHTNIELFKGTSLGWIWSIYNLLMISVSLIVLLDVPKQNLYEWFNLQRVVRLDIAGKIFWGVTTKISEIAVQVTLNEVFELPWFSESPLDVNLEIMEEKLQLSGYITNTCHNSDFLTLQIDFEAPNLEQQRHLIEMLYCRPGQWKRRNTPGELRSLLLLFQTLPRLRFLFNRKQVKFKNPV